MLHASSNPPPYAANAIAAPPVANIAALGAIATAGIPNHAIVWVGYQGWWALDKTSTATPDSITVVAAASGGNWIRTTWGVPGAALRDWYVSATGDDENEGTAGSPVASLAEVLRRRREPVPVGITMTINVASGDYGDVDPVVMDAPILGSVAIVGERVKLTPAPITISSVTQWSGAASVVGKVSCTMATSFAAEGYIGNFMQVASGLRAGHYSPCLVETTSKTVLASWRAADGSIANVLVNDTIDVYEVTSLPSIKLDYAGGGTVTFRYAGCLVNVVNGYATAAYCDIATDGSGVQPSSWQEAVISMTGCLSSTPCGGAVRLDSCHVAGLNGAFAASDEVVITGPAQVYDANVAWFGNSVCAYGTKLAEVTAFGRLLQAGYAWAVNPGTGANSRSIVFAGSQWFYTLAPPTTVGTADATPYTIGGVNTSQASLPVAASSTTHGACIDVYA